jgi:hypothetical protein
VTGTPELQRGASRFVPRHASEEEYREFLVGHSAAGSGIVRDYLGRRRRFEADYPDLADWFDVPLQQRSGRIYRRDENGRVVPVYERVVDGTCYHARPYLYFLALRGYLRFDWEWLVAARSLYVGGYLRHAGLDAEIERMAEEARALGYAEKSIHGALRWAVARFFLHTGNPNMVHTIGDAGIAELEEAVRAFGERDDVELFYGTRESYLSGSKMYHSRLHLLGVVLYHRGRLSEVPRKGGYQRPARSAPRPHMVAVAERYVAARRPTISASHAAQMTINLRAFVNWISETHPEVDDRRRRLQRLGEGGGAAPIHGGASTNY